VSKCWFLSTTVKNQVKKIEELVKLNSLSKAQELPFSFLATHPTELKWIKSNHLHYKFTPEHIDSGIKMKIKEGQLTVPVAVYNQETKESIVTEQVWDSLPHNPTSKKLLEHEMLIDGLEKYNTKDWSYLRPFKPAVDKEGVPLPDTITHSTVKPWGWNPKGGALFGHSSIKMSVDGKLYHFGYNLNGELLNTDFMASVPMKGKKEQIISAPLLTTPSSDRNETQGERIIRKLEAGQKHNKGQTRRPEEVSEEEWSEIKNFRHTLTFQGKTCTSFSTLFYKYVTQKHIEGRSLSSRIIFNPVVNTTLDFFYSILPSKIHSTFIAPLKVLTRAPKPINI
jgi:hypothetical protein